MMKAFVLVCATVLAVPAVFADPPPPLASPDEPDAPAPTKADERAGNDETLQNGGIERPWAAGVLASEQQQALGRFHEGNVQLNDGLFAKASDS
jgi:hypothetical protein